MELAELLARSQKGDKEAFARLAEHYQPYVWRVAWRLMGNRDGKVLAGIAAALFLVSVVGIGLWPGAGVLLNQEKLGMGQKCILHFYGDPTLVGKSMVGASMKDTGGAPASGMATDRKLAITASLEVAV